MGVVVTGHLAGMLASPVITTALIVTLGTAALFWIGTLQIFFNTYVPWSIQIFINEDIKTAFYAPGTALNQYMKWLYKRLCNEVKRLLNKKIEKRKQETLMTNYIKPIGLQYLTLVDKFSDEIAKIILRYSHEETLIELTSKQFSPAWIPDKYKLILISSDTEEKLIPQLDTIYIKERHGQLFYTVITPQGIIVKDVPLDLVTILQPVTIEKLYNIKSAIEGMIYFHGNLINDDDNTIISLNPESVSLLGKCVNMILSIIKKITKQFDPVTMTRKEANKSLWAYFGSHGFIKHQLYILADTPSTKLKPGHLYISSDSDERKTEYLSYIVETSTKDSESTPTMQTFITPFISPKPLLETKMHAPASNSFRYKIDQQDGQLKGNLAYTIRLFALQKGHISFIQEKSNNTLLSLD